LKFERLLSPLETASDKYEKVQVEVMNIGEQAISDAKLQLYLDDKLLATEELGVTLASMESYKHTFDQRIDCSQPGKHNIEIRNVTEGDEQTAHQSMFFSITKKGRRDSLRIVFGGCKLRIHYLSQNWKH